MSNIFLSVVIPAYNESGNLKSGVLDQVDEYLKQQKYSYEVLIVDDGSADNTADLIEEIIKNKKGFSLLRNAHGGKAITVMTGLLKTEGNIVVFTDMDQATPLKEIEKILPKFEEGFDIVIGSRHGRKGATLKRQILALGFVFLRNLIVGLPFSDTQCGFKAFTRETVDKLFPKILERWKKIQTSGASVNAGFDVEFLYIARKMGFNIAEVPVEWHYVGSQRVPFLKNAIEATKDMLRIRINDVQGKYN